MSGARRAPARPSVPTTSIGPNRRRSSRPHSSQRHRRMRNLPRLRLAMESEIRVPPLGESIVEATVGRWLKSPGETVVAGEPVVELETEKVNLEVTADSTGVLQKILHQAGEVVHVGDVLGVVASAVEQPSPAAPTAPPQAAAAPPEVLASPVARQIAADGVRTVVPLCLTPYAFRLSTGAYRARLQ